MRIRGLLFDKDGTILDFHATWTPLNRDVAMFAAAGDEALANKLLIHGGQDPVTGRVNSGTPLAAGTSVQIAECFREYLGVKVPSDLVATIDRLFEEGGRRYSTPVPDAKPTLAAFRRRTSFLGVATHDSVAGISASLEQHGLMEFFDFFAGYDSGHGRKPGPGMLQAFCRASAIDPKEVCVIGDNRHDLDMGLSGGAGLRIGVLTGTSLAKDLEDHADLVVDSIADLARDEAFLAKLA